MDIVYPINILLRQRWVVYELVKRDLKLRYRGSLLGFFWTLLNPLIFTVIYTIVFSIFMRVGIERYPVFLLSGLIPWMWFSESISMGTNSLINGGGFIKSSIFPAEILPAVSVLSTMMNFIFALPILLLFLGIFQVDFGLSLLFLPILMVLHFILALGILLIFSTYVVFFRDLQYLVSHILLGLFFLTPIMYDLSIVPERFHIILKLNPLTILINSYRRIFFYNEFPEWTELGYLFFFSLILLLIGRWVFKNHKEVFAEYL